MKGLKVFLFISFLGTAIGGILALFFPTTAASMGMASQETLYTRVAGTALIGFALAMWYAFRNPEKNVVVVRAVITWFGLEGLVLLISGITGGTTWDSALFGIIFDWVMAAGLVIFYPRAKRAPTTS